MLVYCLTLLEDSDDIPLFCEIYEQYQSLVYRTSLRILKNHHDAEDTAQSTWERVARHFPTAKKYFLNSRSVLAPWLVIIVKNISLDELRRKQKMTEFPEHWDAPAEENAENQSELRELMNLIHTMPEKNRVVLELRLISDCSFTEMGRALGCGEDAARMRYSRALDALRKKLEEEGYVYGKDPVRAAGDEGSP